MGGWKTWAGAAALALSGVSKVLGAVSDFPNVEGAELRDGLEMIGAAAVVVGLGHKIEKSGIVNVK